MTHVSGGEKHNEVLSAASRITLSPHEWTWTQTEVEEMAKSVLDFSERIAELEAQLKAADKLYTETSVLEREVASIWTLRKVLDEYRAAREGE